MAAYTAADLERLRARLYDDTLYWSEKAAKIVDGRAQTVPLEANRAQVRFEGEMRAQEDAGKPIRVIVLKARKVGISTHVQGKIMHRITQRANRRALVVGQDKTTAGELFAIGERIWSHLPPDPELNLKPPRTAFRRGRYMHFGEPSKLLRDRGVLGLDSSLEVDTANEVEAGRGYTYTDLHLSEVAFWPDVRKMIALLNAVPDEPGTLIVKESTANGSNHFKRDWLDAVEGRSSYAWFFVPWFEDDRYQLPFHDLEERQEFEQDVGEGPFGEDEPQLLEMGCTLEQLKWRRQTIVDKCQGIVEVFHQEYPSTWPEAFVAAGKQVFSVAYTSRVVRACELTDPRVPTPECPGPDLGVLKPSATATRKVPEGMVEVPTGTLWVPKSATGFGGEHPFWRRWEKPYYGPRRAKELFARGTIDQAELEAQIEQAGDDWEDDPARAKPPGRYVVAVDPMSGEEMANNEDQTAFHSVQVINHRTLEQVAEYRSRRDPDEVAVEALLAALYYNQAWLAVERTGGYGLSMIRFLWRVVRYPLLYQQKRLEHKKESSEERVGWDTNRSSKVFLEDVIREALRTESDGIRSAGLALELTTYVRDQKMKTGPEPGEFADRLMAYGIARCVGLEKTPPADRPRGATSSTAGYVPRNPVTGY